MEQNILQNDVTHKTNGFKGYVTGTKMVENVLHIQMMLCEKHGRPVKWFKRMWYAQNEVVVDNTQLAFEKAMQESK